MALNNSKCNHLMPLHFKGLSHSPYYTFTHNHLTCISNIGLYFMKIPHWTSSLCLFEVNSGVTDSY